MATSEALGYGIESLPFWLATCIAVLLIITLLIGYLKFSGDIAKLQAKLVESEHELAKRAKDNLQLQESVLRAKREAPAVRPPLTPRIATHQSVAPPAFAPSNASETQRSAFRATATGNGPVLAPVPVTDAPVAQPDPATLTFAIVQESILVAIASLAQDRSSLTEANFVNKVAGFATDAALKALLLANLEPAMFYLCSGERSPQGPELVVYRFKGRPEYSVVPYPSIGRVGQFNRWFENAGSPYGVSPVLASRAAVGVIGEDGSLSVNALGVLA
jgi:hypothetical protein